MVLYDGPMERKLLDVYYKFINTHLSKLGKKPTDLKICCLPGEHFLELSVYDRLGVKRENILGLENKYNIYKKGKKKNWKIDLRYQDALDFICKTKKKFDIINLDYKGYLDEKKGTMLGIMCGRQILNEKSILATTFLGRREKGYFNKEQFLREFISISKKEFLEKIRYMSNDEEKKKLENMIFNEDERIIKHFNLTDEEIKEGGLSSFIIRSVRLGKENIELNPLYKRDPSFNIIKNKLLKSKEKLIEKKLKIYKIAIPYFKTISNEDLKEFFILGFNIESGFIDNIRNYLFSKGYDARLETIASNYYTHPYFIIDMESYKYISTNKSPMLVDFSYLDQNREFLNRYKKIAEQIYINLEDGPWRSALEISRVGFKNMSLKPLIKDLKRKAKELEKDFMRIKNLLFKIPPKRIFLGSDSKMLKLTGEEFYKLRIKGVREGKTKDEIKNYVLENYNTHNNQIKAFEAWITMGKYGLLPKKVVQEELRALEKVKKIKEIKKVKEEIEFKKIKQPKTLDNLVRSIAGKKYLRNCSKNAYLRLKYFVDDVGERKHLFKSIKNTRWYENGLSDMKIYSFFDDITLEVRNGKLPNANKLTKLHRNVLKEKPKKKKIIVKPKLTGGEYYKLRVRTARKIGSKLKWRWGSELVGLDEDRLNDRIKVLDNWALKRYNITKEQLSGLKKWVTMEKYGPLPTLENVIK